MASMEDSVAVAQLSRHNDKVITSDTSAVADRACALLLHKVSMFATNSASVKTGLEVFMKCLDKVCNESQLALFLHTSGNAVPLRYRTGAATKIQSHHWLAEGQV